VGRERQGNREARENPGHVASEVLAAPRKSRLAWLAALCESVRAGLQGTAYTRLGTPSVRDSPVVVVAQPLRYGIRCGG